MADEEKNNINYEEDAGDGLQNLKGKDFTRPFLYILQTGSPELTEGNDKYIEEARAGRICSSVKRGIYKEVTVIPIRYQSSYVEWTPRSEGGGFHGYHQEPPKDAVASMMNNQVMILPNGHEIRDTSFFLCKLMEEDWGLVIVSFASTQLKKARAWNSLIVSQKIIGKDDKPFTPAMYSTKYKLTTDLERNKMGSWYGWKIAPAGRVDDPQLYNECRETAKAQIDFLPQTLLTTGVNGHSDEDDVI